MDRVPEQSDQSGKNSGPEPAAKRDRIYWRVVNLVWLLFAFMMLLAMYLLLGPGFWREFFK